MPSKKRPRPAKPKRVAQKRSPTLHVRPKSSTKTSPARRSKTAAPTPRPKPSPPPAPAPVPVRVRFLELTPSLAVRDVARSRNFYQRLGFAVIAQLPPSGPAEWLRLQRDGVALLIWNQIIAPPEILAAMGTLRGAGNAIRIAVSDVDRLAREFIEDGVTLQRAPETMPDGVRELSIADPDGFLLEFASRPPETAPDHKAP